MNKTIGYGLSKTPDGKIVVTEWTERDQRDHAIEPSNFWPMPCRVEVEIARADLLQKQLDAETAALTLACDRIQDSDQTYEEANTTEGWMDVFRERAAKGEVPVA